MEVEIYTKDDCAYCYMAKMMLQEKNIQYKEQRLFVDFFREEIIEKFPTAKTFPIIVLDGFYIGGYTNLIEHLAKNNCSSSTLLNE